MSPKRGFVPEDLWTLCTVADPQISRDGATVAFVVGTPDSDTDKAASAIYVAPSDGATPARKFSSGPDDSAPRWSPDGNWLAFVSDRGQGPQLHVAPLRGGEAVALTRAPHGVSQPSWSPDSRRLAFAARVGEWKKPEDRSALERSAGRVVRGLYSRFDGVGWFDDRRSHIFVVAVTGGEPSQLTDGDFDDSDPAWSPDGRNVAFVSDRSATRFDSVHRDVWVVSAGTGRRARRLTRGKGTAASPKWSPDGRTIAYIGHENDDGDSASNTHLLVVDAADPEPPRSLSASLDRTVWGLLGAAGQALSWSEDGRSVLFMVLDRGSFAMYRAALRAPRPELVVGGDRQILAMDAAGPTIAYVAQWANLAPEVFCSRSDGTAERRLSNANAKVRSLRLAPLRRISTVAPDGRRIESFVMYPPGHVKGRPAPTVFEIHGGPHGCHPQTTLLGLYQALVAAGYVVVLPNPRGSHGYGEEFARACVGDWGGADFEDVMAVADDLVAGGVADPKRMYITGYSYGGFMTSWAIGHTSRFAAACVAAPVTDLASMWGTTDIPDFAERELGGLPWQRPDLYAKHSPVTYLDDVTTPVQLFHWEGDLRCPVGQSEQLFQGLRRLRREVVMVRYPGGFHIVRSTSQMVDYLARHIAWFGGHRLPASRARRTTRS